METNRILLVDDEEAFLFGFSRILQSNEVSVDTAKSAASAKSLIQSTHYKVIISDLILSNSSKIEGYDIIRYAKEVQPHSKIIIITAYGKEDTKEQMSLLGVDYFFEKPVSPMNLKGIIAAM